MHVKGNLWKNDKGFIWMLAISVLSLISTQISIGIIGESKFIVRLGYFLFTVIAIRSSSLHRIGKSIGYIIASTLLLLAIVLVWSETILDLTVRHAGHRLHDLHYNAVG
jgi:hypothetical protein